MVIFTKKLNPRYDVLLNKVYKDLPSGKADSAIISTGTSVSKYLATYRLKDIIPNYGSAELKDLTFQITPTAITSDFAVSFPLDIHKVKKDLISTSEGTPELVTTDNCAFSATFSETNYIMNEIFDGEAKGFKTIQRLLDYKVARREAKRVVIYSKPYILSHQFKTIINANGFYDHTQADLEEKHGNSSEPEKIFMEPHTEWRSYATYDKGATAYSWTTLLVNGSGAVEDNWEGYRPIKGSEWFGDSEGGEYYEITLSNIVSNGGFHYDKISDTSEGDDTILIQPSNSVFDRVHHEQNIFHTYGEAAEGDANGGSTPEGRTLVSAADVTFDSQATSGTNSAKFYAYAMDTTASSDTVDTGDTLPVVEVKTKFEQHCMASVHNIPRPVVSDFTGKDMASNFTVGNYSDIDYSEILPYIEFDINIEKLPCMYQVSGTGQYVSKRSFCVLMGERVPLEGESMKEYIDGSYNSGTDSENFLGFSIMNINPNSNGTNNYQVRPLDSWLFKDGANDANGNGYGQIPSSGTGHTAINSSIYYSNAEAPLGMSIPEGEWVKCRMYFPIHNENEDTQEIPIFFHNSDGSLLNNKGKSGLFARLALNDYFDNGFEKNSHTHRWPGVMSFWLNNHWRNETGVSNEVDTIRGEREAIVRIDSIKFCNFEPLKRNNSQSAVNLTATSPISIGANEVIAPLKGAGAITGVAGTNAITATADGTFDSSDWTSTGCALSGTTVTYADISSEDAAEKPKIGMLITGTGILSNTYIEKVIGNTSFTTSTILTPGSSIEVTFHCVTVTSADHGLVKSDKISISGTTDYNGIEQVVHKIDANSFMIGETWVDNQTGTFVGPFNNHTRLTDTSNGKFEADKMNIEVGDLVVNRSNGGTSFVTEVVNDNEVIVSGTRNSGASDDEGLDAHGHVIGNAGFGLNDKYFIYGMNRKVTSPTYLSFGFKNLAQITGTSNLLFSNFSTDDLSNREEIDSSNIRMATNKTIIGTEPLGMQIGTDKLHTDKLTDGTHYEFNTDAYHVDNFSQHGWASIGFADDSSIGGDTALTSRENQIAATRILEISDNFTIKVTSEVPLGLVDGQEFIIYVHGRNAAAQHKTVTLEKVDICTFKIKDTADGLKDFIYNNISSPTVYGANDRGYESCLWISPKMYWVWCQISPFDTNDKQVPVRRYGSVCTTDVIPTTSGHLGATWNEALFSETYSNSWSLDAVHQSLIEYSHNFGYVSESQEGIDQKISESAVVKSYVSGTGEQLFSNPRSSFFDIVKETFDNNLTFMYGINSAINKNCSFTVDTREGTNPIQLWVEMEDTLPKAPKNFKLTPNKDNNHNIDFTWEIEDNDLWYGFLFVSDKQINSQYHNAIAHFPLNETSGQSWVFKPDQGENYLNSAGTSRTAHNFETGSGAFVDGLSGYAKNFTNAADYLKFAGTGFSTIGGKFSIVIHATPEYIATTDDRTLLYQSGRMRISLQSTSSVTYAKAEITDAAGSPATVTLKSMPLFTGGNTPISIIVTVDADLKSNGAKLFIDGGLVDQKDWASGVGVASNTNDIFIGSDATSSTDEAQSYLEEIVLYNDIIYPIKPSSLLFLYDREETELNSQSTESPKSFNARLFSKDYHNIRGYTKQEVAASSQLTFERPSFALSLA